MATMSATFINHHCSFSFIQSHHHSSSPPNLPLGCQQVAKKVKVMCSMKERRKRIALALGMSAASLLAAAVMSSSPAMALVDEIMSTEGTGLPFGFSNNLLGWILFGVFGLIWALYFVYTSSLEEDEESGLSL
ncbi:hypothetical protein E1A91_A08G206400v1 [Gossypium mustelinum]|uniref:PSII 6.1 kDa protein n=1 Tax=Gossypium mustelinum TaxID=34275 RepID=A0A5D2YC15_GOSMU|nr:hypothetical protein E1A91_A08G206400v1 [Gossypium mustelinum]